MFGKTKVKIVFTVVLSLLALMIVTLSTIYLSSRAAMRNENDEMLMTYIGLYDPENRQGDCRAAERRGIYDPGGPADKRRRESHAGGIAQRSCDDQG